MVWSLAMGKGYICPNMNIGNLISTLTEISKEMGYNTEVWISSDEEGNEFLPMLSKEEIGVGIDKNNKRIIFFPSHR
jgi:hypothetical protein